VICADILSSKIQYEGSVGNPANKPIKQDKNMLAVVRASLF
jgi:hypothetical protein